MLSCFELCYFVILKFICNWIRIAINLMDIKDLITLIGITVSLIVGFTGLFISFHNSKKTIFINSVTTSRVKWIDTLRNNISEYCGLAFQIFQSSSGEKLNKMDRIQQLRFLIKLQLNRSDPYDILVIEKIDSISTHVYDDSRQEIEKEINSLITLTQDLLKLEWEGIKKESQKGNLSKTEKERLYKKYQRSKIDKKTL
jgi:hypothetical protein